MVKIKPEETKDSKQEQALKEIQVFNAEAAWYGIPKKLAYATMAMSMAFLQIMPWYFCLLFLIIALYTLSAIYTDDPRALLAWKRGFSSKTHWSAGVSKRRTITFIEQPLRKD